MEDIKNVREKELLEREKEREEEKEHRAKMLAIKEKELQFQAAMKEQELQTQRYIKEMEIKAKEREMERMAKEREREMDMQILNADTSTMSEKRRALHEIAYMARNFDDMFNEALYGKRRRQDNTLIDNWIDEYLLEDSEEEDTDRSSIPITRRWINRDREAGHDRLFQDYFADDPVYHADIFRRRFRMRRHVFLRIVDALSNVYPYFQQRVDATGRRGLSPLQKCTAAIRMLAYGVAADVVDDYVRIGESTTIECLEKFVEGVISVFEDEYLRKPNPNDVQRLLQMAEGRGFPGMLGSIDCMHWQWKNCPKAWKGMYMSGYRGVATIVLEVVASSDLWIWHAFFGVSGSNNNINVLDRSPVFDDILNDRAPEVNYTINGNNYTMGYYLADGIYPEWATFVKSISKPQGKKRKLFAQYQEGQRKDVERAFGVLQARFAIIRGPARFWEKKKLANIMRACIILHNMIVEDERDTYAGNFAQGLEYDDVENGLSQPQLGEEDFAPYHQFLQRNAQLRNRQQHRQLKEDLIEHIWQFHNACRQL
ncbi:Putative nuclease [Arachis hypogaea]|nr:Putative nuclease [Arachis hypogaea]